MKFAHISDTHLGQTRYGIQELEDDMYNALDEAVDISIKDRVNFVILAGDLFDKPVPNGRAIVSMGNSLKKLKNAEIPAYFVLGEHDISRIRATPVAYVYDSLDVATYIGDGRPVYHKDIMLVGFDKMRRDEIGHHASRLADADSAAREHTGRSVLIMHQGVMEVSKFAGEIAVSEMPKSFSYYAMGHLHNRYERHFESLGGPLAYPGSTEITALNFTHDTKKGFCEVDLSGDEATTDWIGLDTRPHLEFDVECGSMDVRAAEIATEISQLEKDPVVRLNVRCAREEVGVAHERASPILKEALHLQIKTIQTDIKSDGVEVMEEEPMHMDVERKRLIEKALGDVQLSELTLNSLLPLLSSGKTNEALKVVLDDYETFKESLK